MCSLPLVTALCVTHGRHQWLPQMMRYYLRQDYPRKELVILDDSPEPYPGIIPDGIRYYWQDYRREIGTKRNRAVSLAQGEIIASFDDDDWFAPGYLSMMLAPLVRGESDVSVATIQALLVFDVATWQYWRYVDDERLFNFIHDGTLCFRRLWWERGCHYPDQGRGESSVLMQHMQLEGARLATIKSQENFVYVRHGENIWAFHPGSFLRADLWERVEEDGKWPIGEQDRAFYRARLHHSR